MTEPKPKRRKVSLACGECRERKRKCDGLQPVCGGCARRKPQPTCLYTDENLKRGSSSYVQSLRDRIRELEEDAAAYARSSAGPPSPPASETVQDPRTLPEHTVITELERHSLSLDCFNTEEVHPVLDWPTAPSLPDQPFESISSPRSTSKTVTNSSLDFDECEEYVGIGVMGTMSGGLCSECRGLRGEKSDYSAPSSVVDFDRQIRHWTVRPAASRYVFPSTIDATPKICRCSPSETIPAPLFETEVSIPPRATADALVGSYFERVHRLYPFLHQPTFMKSYLQLWQPVSNHKNKCRRITDSRLFHGLLNAVFALGSRFSSYLELTERISTSEVFYSRAIKSLNLQLLERGNIELVQTLLLTAQYLQSTQMWGMCWNMAGLAIRVAQGIGLHPPSPDTTKNTTKKSLPSLNDEMRKRVWGGCVILDRVLAMVYGKPPMLHPSSTRSFINNLPSMTDEELLDTPEKSIELQAPTEIDCFVQSLKLIHYLGDILDSLHIETPDQVVLDGIQSGLGTAQFERILDRDSTLANWQKQLPIHLQIRDQLPGSPFWRESRVLRARYEKMIGVRYLHMRMFLLRPVLLAFLQQGHSPAPFHDVDESVQHSVELDRLTRVSTICITVTRALIDLIHTDVHNGQDLAIVWWYGVYYIYTCATIIHAARLFPLLLEYGSVKTLQEIFYECLQCLDKYEVYGVPAKRCRSTLAMLERRAFPAGASKSTHNLSASGALK
ncbi:hypothetical protein EJ08DRAFT_590871 [Tothia fuscella]|uniref:Zn(2)-C6 fungal-type domain-containing protein n=1 Tax=Tothia fuscella TaxID=1048955 RepID=A0A9P4TXM2_9PEZI|nr:hypothetical protein EJ08DRAFT_590871 [Tothia fuscella]